MIITRLPNYAGPDLPKYQTDGAAGFDLYASSTNDIYYVGFGMVTIIPTGMKIIVPAGHEGQVRARGGLAAKNGVMVINAPGTVDSDYRGEVMVLLTSCMNGQPLVVKPGERIAQMVITEYTRVDFTEVSEAEYGNYGTARGDGRFGSTGTK